MTHATSCLESKRWLPKLAQHVHGYMVKRCAWSGHRGQPHEHDANDECYHAMHVLPHNQCAGSCLLLHMQ
jgi:hypothetical protein